MNTWAIMATEHATLSSGIGLNAIPGLGSAAFNGFAVVVVAGGAYLAFLGSPWRSAGVPLMSALGVARLPRPGRSRPAPASSQAGGQRRRTAAGDLTTMAIAPARTRRRAMRELGRHALAADASSRTAAELRPLSLAIAPAEPGARATPDTGPLAPPDAAPQAEALTLRDLSPAASAEAVTRGEALTLRDLRPPAPAEGVPPCEALTLWDLSPVAPADAAPLAAALTVPDLSPVAMAGVSAEATLPDLRPAMTVARADAVAQTWPDLIPLDPSGTPGSANPPMAADLRPLPVAERSEETRPYCDAAEGGRNSLAKSIWLPGPVTYADLAPERLGSEPLGAEATRWSFSPVEDFFPESAVSQEPGGRTARRRASRRSSASRRPSRRAGLRKRLDLMLSGMLGDDSEDKRPWDEFPDDLSWNPGESRDTKPGGGYQSKHRLRDASREADRSGADRSGADRSGAGRWVPRHAAPPRVSASLKLGTRYTPQGIRYSPRPAG